MTAPSRFARLTFAGVACLIAASAGFAETRPLPDAGGFVGPAGPDSCCSIGPPASPEPDPQLGDVGSEPAPVSATTKSPEAVIALDHDSAARAADRVPAAAAREPPPATAPQSGLIGFLSSIIQSGVATPP